MLLRMQVILATHLIWGICGIKYRILYGYWHLEMWIKNNSLHECQKKYYIKFRERAADYGHCIICSFSFYGNYFPFFFLIPPMNMFLCIDIFEIKMHFICIWVLISTSQSNYHAYMHISSQCKIMGPSTWSLSQLTKWPNGRISHVRHE